MFRPAGFLFSSIHQLTTKRFAGHSKWANIKHDKAIADQKRADRFQRLSRMIRIAIQEGGSTDPKVNTILRTAIDQATKLNMPQATINNQIKKFNAKDNQLKRYWFEMKSMNKVFLILECYTEHYTIAKNNTSSAMRRAGNTAFADIKHKFQEHGLVQVSRPDEKFANAQEFEDKLMEDAIECNAQEVEDIDFESKSALFICPPIEVERVKRNLLNLGYVVEQAEHVFLPDSTCTLNEEEMKTYTILTKRLSEIDGFERIFDNVEQSTE